MGHAVACGLRQRGSAAFAYLFGSFPQGLPFEDVDVAVYLAEAAEDPLTAALDLAAQLEEQAVLPVDVAVLHDAPVGLALAAVRGVLVFCRDPGAWQAFLEQTALRALDTEHLRRESLSGRSSGSAPPEGALLRRPGARGI